MRIPRINRKNGSGWVRKGMGGCLVRTIKNRTDDNSSKIGLLRIVQVVWDLWGIRIIRPRLLLKVRHGSVVYEGGRDRGWERGFRGEKGPRSPIRELWFLKPRKG